MTVDRPERSELFWIERRRWWFHRCPDRLVKGFQSRQQLPSTLLGALLFYLVSNTVSWLTVPGYAKTIAGWVQALTVGLPGFPPTWVFGLKSLLGTGLFTGLFAGAMKWSEALDATEPEPELDDEEEVETPSESAPETA